MKPVNFIIFVLFYITLECHAGLVGRNQSISVKGRVRCGNKPAKDVLIKLIDTDTGTIDDKLDEKKTNANGEFFVSGSTVEVTDIDPQLNIYHDCNKSPINPCQRKWKLLIPGSYINTRNVMDIGEWNLETIIPEESTDCIH